MNKKILTVIFFCLVWQIGSTQNVGISTGGSTPRDCAMLDILSSTKGLLIPNLALTAITTYAPATGTAVDGLLIYNTAAGVGNGTGYYYWSVPGAKWVNLLDNYPADYWSLIGNTGTTASSSAIGTAVNNNFIGTTDNKDFVLATNNLERLRILGSNGTLCFPDLTQSLVNADGMTWYSPAATSYGIFKSAGTWTGPNYQQLQLAFQTGIVIDGGSLYGLSGTVLQPGAGNVGIGVTTPTQKLHVSGNVRFSGALMPNNLPGTTGQVLISQGAGVAPIWSTTGYSGQWSAQWLSSTSAGQKFQVPSGITTVTVELWGGGGGPGGGVSYYNQGGSGAYAYGIITVTPGQVLTVIVGAGGSYNGLYASYPDGGSAGGSGTTYEGGGGGRSAIQIVAGTDIICAGGGGGGGAGGGSNGAGGGGGAGAFGGSGSAGMTAGGGGGGGGTQASGGAAGAGGGTAATAGTAYTGVGGGSGGTNTGKGGGGGGGGYYGGGGGGSNGTNSTNGGGGGGSSWYNAGSVTSPSSIAGTSGAAGGTLPVPAPNNTAADYTGSSSYGPGAGGGVNTYIYPGGPGLVVIHW
jgi:hypothetical protein